MADHYFVSYSSVDGQEFIPWLVDRLAAGPPPIPVWFDQRQLRPGQDWDIQLVEAIRACRALLFVMTPDSVQDTSVCKREWLRALKYKKPIIPLRLHPDAELPFQLEPRQYIDFTDSFDEGLARLRQHLAWMDSPEGALQALVERLSDAERESERSLTPPEQARIRGEIEQLQQQITELRRLLADPGAAHQSAEQRIASGLERERAPERPVPVRRARYVNPPPMLAPVWFQDRHVETQMVGDFLKEDGQRMLTVVGRGGIGKTALVVRVLKAVEGGQLPDDQGPFVMDGIVYLSPVGAHTVSFPNLVADLSRLLPEEVAERLEQRQHPQQSVKETMSALLEAFSNKRVVVLLDSFDDMIDSTTLEIADRALDEALRSVLLAPRHGLKVILITRVAPRSLLLVQPARQRLLDLSEGLGPPYAENLLRAMDPDGTLGLKNAPDEQLRTARERTRGSPRALEALVAILAADRDTSLPELLAETGGLLPENVVDVLVGEAFSRLDPLAQQVMQALASYGLPVPAVAVDYLLQPYRQAIDSVPVLARLVDMQLVRRAGDRYYLDQVDRDYALSRISVGNRADRDTNPPPFTQDALRARGARFFEKIRLPTEAAKQLEDLWPQLAEFELQCAIGEYDAAARLVLSIEDQLLAWGHLNLFADLHERLQGQLDDPELRRLSLVSLQRAQQLFRLPDGQPLEQGGPRLQSTFRGHQAPVTRLAWLPDGQRLLSASLDGTLRLWDCQYGRELKVLRGHSSQVLAVAVAADGLRAISASADQTLRIWDLRTGAEVGVLTGHTNSVTAVAISQDGRTAISGAWDRTLKVWDLDTGDVVRTLQGHTDRINAVIFTRDGRRAISGGWDQTLRVWDVHTGAEEQTLPSRAGGFNDIVALAGGQLVASGAEDATIHVWRLSDGHQLTILQGPTAYVTGVSVSADGRVLAAKSADHTVRFWRTDTWDPIGVIAERSPSNSRFAGTAFSPRADLLATLGEDDTIIRVWDFDTGSLLERGVAGAAVQYTTAKVVLVGEQGVGKTGLGFRLAHGVYRPTDSTHGQYFWVIKSLQPSGPDDPECDVILWDFAGQVDYRLVHALFLEEVDLALVVFDPTRDKPFEAVQYWLNQLRRQDRLTPTVLVAGRIDVGAPRRTSEEILRWCEEAGVVGGYVATSAKTNEGVDDLKARISGRVVWRDKSPTVSPRIFTQIKQAVLSLREKIAADDQPDGLRRLVSPEQLSGLLAGPAGTDVPVFSFDEMMTAVGHLAKHGVVSLLESSTGDQVILLVPDVLNNLAASIIVEARRSRFGMLDETRLASGDYRFQELAHFDNQQQTILLDAAIVLFLKRNLCFRETIAGVTNLIFPSLINQERPADTGVGTVDDVSYYVTGRVENVYASLVVQLGHTGTFSRTDQWRNQAQFEMGPEQICGFRQIESHAGATEFVLYYATTASNSTRTLFRLLFERFLGEQDLHISSYQPIVCPRCGYRQDRNAVMRRVREGKTRIGCANACGAVIELAVSADKPTLSPAVQERANKEQLRTQLRTAFEVALVNLRRTLREQPDTHQPSCFISYAWGKAEDERWVVELAKDLKNAGVGVLLDQWDNAEPGHSIARFIQRIYDCDFVLAVGTPLYKRKADNEVSEEGSVAAAEVDMINNKLMGTEQEKRTVLPLLRTGIVKDSLPQFLWGRTIADFRADERYFVALLDVILTLHRLSFTDPTIATIRDDLREDLARSGAVPVT